MSEATDQAVYKTLLESTRAIPWKIDWKSMTFAYIGPQIESVGLVAGQLGQRRGLGDAHAPG